MTMTPTETATEIAAENGRHWTLAILVVFSGLTVGASFGAELGHPILGALVGIGGGLVGNYTRGCIPCRRHVASLTSTSRAPSPSAPLPENCPRCARQRARQQQV